MKVIYLSTALSDEIFSEITEKCKTFKPTFSGVGFDRNVAKGISELVDVEPVSLYPIPSWPKYRKIKQGAQSFRVGEIDFFAPALFDVPIMKEKSFCKSTIKYIEKKCKKGEKFDAVLISGLYRTFLRPARILKKKLGIPVYAIVPDLPELMITYRKDYSFARRIINRIDTKVAQKYRSSIDGFVFLSSYMNEAINDKNKPFVIVDGLCDVDISLPNEIVKREKYILYAGKISKKFGVDILVEGFKLANLEEMKLYLCGDGDYAEQLRVISKQDDRIEFFGLLPHDKIMEMERKASLLVDPRYTNSDIVKMSFPSKIIEYMASGTPVLTTNMPCFSEEYQNYQYRIDEESALGIAAALQKVFNISEHQRSLLGSNARSFVLENKTLSKQCRTIVGLINKGHKYEDR